MMEEFAQPFSKSHFLFIGLLIFSRGMDLLSTWVATPNLVLEGNPIAKALGWRWGCILNLVLSIAFGLWPFSAIIVATTSLMVAARNFQSAWLMRLLGEANYRDWFIARISETSTPLYLLCLLGQTFLVGSVGVGLLLFSFENLITLAIGLGIVIYAFTVLFYTLLATWRLRRRSV